MLRLTVAGIAVLGLLVGMARAEWGGGLSAVASDVRSDSTRSTVLDQNYDGHVSGRLLPRLQYLGAIRYRLLHNETSDAPPLRYTEMQPEVTVTWATPAHTLRSNYLYRQIQDDRNLNHFSARAAGVFFQTNTLKLPRVSARYEWNQNVNDLDLLGRDTRSRILAAGTRFDRRFVSVAYDFQDSETANRVTGLKFDSRQHNGRIDNSLHLFRQLVSMQTSYQVTDRTEVQRSSFNGPILISLPAVAGLHAVDPSPEFGELLSLPALIDGNDSIPASYDINLSGSEVQNLGLDFGSPLDVDRLFLSTDTLGNPGLRWAVFTSNDNLTWDKVRDYAPAPFEPVFDRYEVSFTRQKTRYIKLVAQPLLQNTSVHPTELRAFLSRTDQNAPEHSTDHRGSMDFQIVPAKWVQLGAGAQIVRIEGTQTSLARRQDALRANVRLNPRPWADVLLRADRSQSGPGHGLQDRVDTDQYSASVQSRWLPTLTTLASASRTLERTEGRSSLRNDGYVARATAQWLPGLEQISEIGYLENHNIQSGDVVTTRYFSELFDTRPTQTSVARLEYRRYSLDARLGDAPSYRQTLTANVNFAVTPLITVGGDFTLNDEPRRATRTESGQISWNPTFKWMFSGSVVRSEWTDEAATTLYSAEAFFRLTIRTDITAGYAFTNYDHGPQPDVTSARMGLSTRF